NTSMVSVVAMAYCGYIGKSKTSVTPCLYNAANPFLIDGCPYLIAKATGISTFGLIFCTVLSEITISGEPSFHQIFWYAAADFFGRVFRIIPLTINVRNQYGRSITRLSIRNSSRYGLTASGVGDSGE